MARGPLNASAVSVVRTERGGSCRENAATMTAKTTTISPTR